jgi:hypothetical protein|tara:strand:- start:806 stop:1084 length:279 start_codon:yes stop_codon:yes gene_type:complete
MESPYTFCSKNPRKVLEVNGEPVSASNKIMLGASVFYIASIYAYSRRFLRIDGNGVTAGAFALFSMPASYSYARFFFSDAETEAALLNNSNE